MPAEWDRHEATWLAWPHNPEDWPGKFQPIPWLYAEIVRLLAAHERVHLIVQDGKEESRANGILRRAGADLGQVTFHQWPTDRVWTRDSGPIFVRNPEGRVAITNWKFNAWAKYDDWHLDDQLPARDRRRTEPAGMAAVDHAPRRLGAPPGSRRRIHRHQRRRHPADHRRVPVERSAAAQSRREPRAAGAGVARFPRHRPGDLAGPRRGRRRYPWAHRRHQPLCRPVDDHYGGRAQHLRSEPRAARGESPAPQGRPHARRQAIHHRRTSPAAPGCLSRPAPAGQLRQFLRGQRPGAGAHVPRSQRPHRAQHSCRSVPRPRSHRHPLRGPDLGPRRAALHDPATACRTPHEQGPVRGTPGAVPSQA